MFTKSFSLVWRNGDTLAANGKRVLLFVRVRVYERAACVSAEYVQMKLLILYPPFFQARSASTTTAAPRALPPSRK